MSLPHDAAHTHITGKSEFVDDRPIMRNELFMDVFYSTRAHAEISELSFDDVYTDPKVVAVFTAKDIKHNIWGTIFQDQPILAEKVVQFAGEPIALIVAEDMEAAQYAKQRVKIKYKDLPAILSIDEAKKSKSFIGDERKIERGNIEEGFASAAHVIEDEIIINAHDHFYLESQASVVYPLEDGQLEVHTSSQHPTESQHVVSHALGLSLKDVLVQVKRLGGGFGGKESQAAPFAAMAAVGAQKLNRPVRLALTKDDDMVITGKRNPFKNDFKVGFDENGKITALEVKLFSDGGAYADLSTAIMERAMLHSDNAYFIPNIKVTGQVCRTNHHPHTAYRGFGGPKGVATAEIIIEKIAHHLGKDALEIRRINQYQNEGELEGEKNITHYGQVFKNNCFDKLFSKLTTDCNYDKRRKEIEEFNKTNDQYLRGMSLTPVKFGISFTTRFLNQGNALVIIYTDGSVQVATGATEMGQGVNARIAELVCSELGLERKSIRMMPTRTDKNANTSPTAASSGTDINGSAAILATRKIKRRLSELAVQLFEIPEENWAKNTAGLGCAPELNVDTSFENHCRPNEDADWHSGVANYHDVKFENGHVVSLNDQSKKISFYDLVTEAYLNRVSLCDYAYYKIPGIEFNKLTGEGDAFLYFSQGVACSEVKLNRDTGEVKVTRTDILMDLGRPINKDLDIGQVSGAFIQGMGWVTMENLVYDDQGFLLSHSPSTYKIPSVQDVPRTFNVELLKNDENYANVRGTKAVGEPPLLLALSVWAAINNALTYLPEYKESFPKIKIPATSEEVLRAMYPEKFKKWDQKAK